MEVNVIKLEGRSLEFSPVERQRIEFQPRLPSIFYGPHHIEQREALGAAGDKEEIQRLFPSTYGKPRVEFVEGGEQKLSEKPLRMAVVLSGGQAPGGHSVIAGIFDYIKSRHPESILYGFLNGPHGIFTGNATIIDDDLMSRYRNMGGFDIIGSGRHKIETEEQFFNSKASCEALELDGLVVIGGDDSNTNAAVLAEYFVANGCNTRVIGAPKTIDGDLKNKYIPVSFGFDTACKTYSELIGNVAFDAISSQKYYHFVRLMGRSASHIALECALQTRPNAALIGEEVKERNQSIESISKDLAQLVIQRHRLGKDYGVILLPEGLIEFIPEMNRLISEINNVVAGVDNVTIDSIQSHLSEENAQAFAYLPLDIKKQLLLDRDAHGNVQVAKIETERLICGTVQQELQEAKSKGEYNGDFMAQFHYFGYEGRSGLPSNFDVNYCYSIGYTAAALVEQNETGLMASIGNITSSVEQWTAGGVPTTMMMNLETRKGKSKPVIRKALTELDGKPFRVFQENRDRWAIEDFYRSPGPIQFIGPGSDDITFTLQYEQEDQ